MPRRRMRDELMKSIRGYLLFHSRIDSPLGKINIYGFDPPCAFAARTCERGGKPTKLYPSIRFKLSYRWSR
jgi:hypothetical protein